MNGQGISQNISSGIQIQPMLRLNRVGISERHCQLAIQIQPMLRLNLICSFPLIQSWTIQIQPMLRLNFAPDSVGQKTCSNSNTTNVKVKCFKQL